MTGQPTAQADLDYGVMLSLIADPRDAYRHDTATLQRIAARVPGLQHGLRPGSPIFDTAEQLRVAIVVTLCARAMVDKQLALSPSIASSAVLGPHAAPPSTGGGQRVPVTPRPPAPAPSGYALPDGAL